MAASDSSRWVCIAQHSARHIEGAQRGVLDEWMSERISSRMTSRTLAETMGGQGTCPGELSVLTVKHLEDPPGFLSGIHF